MLQVGDVMKKVYGNALGLLNKPISMPRSPNSTQPQSLYPTDEIIIYSTRYRRTFQSAMAMMFSFIPTERWLQLSIKESHSLAFCFSDCACPKADEIKDLLAKEFAQQLNHNPTVAAVVQWIGSNIFQNPTPKMQPLEVRDGILSLICHNAPLPCRRNGISQSYGRQSDSDQDTSGSTTESNDLINIDQDVDMNSNSLSNNVVNGDSLSNRIIDSDADAESASDGCVEASHVEALMAYTQKQGDREAKNYLTRQQGLLRSYGLIRNIVAHMLKIISGDKTKFVLYSGHDRTLQFLMSALGLFSNNNHNNQNDGNPKLSYHIPYASRLAFEIYKSDAGNGDLTEYYFRVVANGIDFTRNIEFCEGGRSLRIIKNNRGSKADLCPIENIIRFIHDDYFTSFNVTNQKDACMMQKNSEF